MVEATLGGGAAARAPGGRLRLGGQLRGGTDLWAGGGPHGGAGGGIGARCGAACMAGRGPYEGQRWIVWLMAEPVFEGVAVALVSLFDGDDRLLVSETAEHAASLVERGVEAVAVAGTTGEPWRLDDDERVALVEACRTTLPGDVAVIAGTGRFGSGQGPGFDGAVLGGRRRCRARAVSGRRPRRYPRSTSRSRGQRQVFPSWRTTSRRSSTWDRHG